MSTLATFTKQPADQRDYDISFVDWLAASNDTAQSVVCTVDSGITQPFPASVNNGVVKVWAAGGTNGQAYKYTVTLTTANQRIKQVEITIKVKET